MSTMYMGPINITATMVVRAIAYAPGAIHSSISSESYAHTLPFPPCRLSLSFARYVLAPFPSLDNRLVVFLTGDPNRYPSPLAVDLLHLFNHSFVFSTSLACLSSLSMSLIVLIGRCIVPRAF